MCVQDDGAGMDPETIRRCMSFGFSDKKMKSSIGQCTDAILLTSPFSCLPFFWYQLIAVAFQMEMGLRQVLCDLDQMLSCLPVT